MQNLIVQFPDITQRTRTKFRISKQRYYNRTHNENYPNQSNEKLEQFYDIEFRKRHYKLLFMVLGCVVALYLIFASIPGFIAWV
jgi:hypothetical protein